MSAQLFIHRVRLRAAERDYTWDFRPGVNVVVGPIGVGKTSLLELIKYGFGGDGVLTRTVQSVGRQMQLDVELADKRWVLSRGIGRGGGRVDVLSDDEQVASFAVEAGPDEEGISDFLLEALDIPRLTLPRSRARPRDELTRISFRDVYVYLYLDQQEIDRSTAHDVDPLRNPKRQMTFELLYRLVDSKLAELRVAQVQADAALRRLQELASNSRTLDDGPDARVADRAYIEREAQRLWAIAERRQAPTFPYPGLVKWTPPRTALDCLGEQNGALLWPASAQAPATTKSSLDPERTRARGAGWTYGSDSGCSSSVGDHVRSPCQAHSS